MAKAVITILGTIGVPREGQERAEYIFSDSLKENFSLKKDRYTNMLPLLIDNFEQEYSIDCIYTNFAKITQSKVLNYENIEFDIEENGVFISEDTLKDGKEIEESKYSYFLQKYNEIIEKYDSVIIDVSHGFRHLPILATVNMIMQNIQNPKKIEYVFFAKEVIRLEKYEIIDLKEYLELANLSFLLSSFNQNYTVSSNIRFKNPLYKEIAKELAQFSHHFLSNSLKPLIEGNLISDIIDNLEKLQKDKSVEHFKHYIEEIILHLEEIRQLKHDIEWKKLYHLSKIMDKRGYQLNAITLLFEAVGFYCKDKIMDISDEIKEHINKFETDLIGKKEPKTKYSLYALVNQSRNIVKLSNDANNDKFKGDYLYNPQTINLSKGQYRRKSKNDKDLLKVDIKRIINDIETHVKSCKDISYFQDFIRDIEDLRNNLAHGNSSHSILDVKQEYQEILEEFEYYCITNDILKVI